MERPDRHHPAAVQASEWTLRLREGKLTRAERSEYFEWLRKSPLHVAEMLRVSEVHAGLLDFRGWKEVAPLDAPSTTTPVLDISDGRMPRGKVESPRISLFWLRFSAGAFAMVAVAVGIAIAYFGHPSYRTIDTGPAERREVKLADGSEVRIGPETTLSVRFTEHERRVVLVRGDALFHVAKDRTKPFLVESDHTRVRAVGTMFGVEDDEGAIIVTVEEGRVAVAQTAAHLASSAPLPAEVSLVADQQMVVSKTGSPAWIHKVDSHRELAWADGRLVFEQDPVAEVIKRFNHFNRVQIKVLDPQLAKRSVSAVFDASDPGAFITFIKSVANVRVSYPSPDTIVIESDGPS